MVGEVVGLQAETVVEGHGLVESVLGGDQEVGAGVETAAGVGVGQRLGAGGQELLAGCQVALVGQVAHVVHARGSHVVVGLVLVR